LLSNSAGERVPCPYPLIFDAIKGGAMDSQIGITFPHRHNTDGTHDSICTACFLTVGTEEMEAKLRPYELAHVCDPVELYRVSQACVPAA
jgi:hypothetical protein